MSLQNVCFCNQHILSELITTINSSPADVYSKSIPGDSRQTIGMHTRHIIEFYQCFFTVLTSQHINYDERKRNTALEELRSEGVLALRQIITQIADFQSAPEGQKLLLTSVTDTKGTSITIESSPERELLFLHSHTTHHMAIINLLLKQAGHSPEKELGIATSTQIYRSNQMVSS